MQAALAKAPPLAEGTHIYDALTAAVAQVRGSALGGARVVLLSDGDDVGSAATLDSALEQLKGQGIRVYTVGIESPDFKSDDLETIAEPDRWHVRGRELARGAHDRSTTSSASSSATSTSSGTARRRQPDQDVDVAVAVVGAEPVSFSYTSPSTGTAAPFEPAFRDQPAAVGRS